ncbi:MAG: DinB family protein, partial [Bryobacteraceae bacterium]
WSLTKAGEPVLVLPRVGLFRTILLNHLYHHRGQLTVYLRLLDVPIPSIYGPSADENPFA